jgi:hypothetical protein
MQKTIVYFCLLLIVSSCDKELGPAEIKHLNGYWEIDHVVFPSGENKEYKINETIDHFQMSGNSGVRKKLKPQFDGKYLENGQFEKVLVKDGKQPFLEYKTDFATWHEEIVGLSKEELVLKNQSGIEYHYRRPIPFSIK